MENPSTPKIFKNHFVRWGVTIPVVLGCVFIAAAIMLHTGFFRNDIDADIVAISFILIATVVSSNLLIKFLGHRLNREYMLHFHFDESTLSFQETRQLTNIKLDSDHIVLLFHGFSASTQEFKCLIAHFDKHKIAYYAPKITGFGVANTKLLTDVRAEDWFRIAVESYDLMSQIAGKISIVGHSMGCILATHVAKHRHVDHLILSAPGLYSCESDLVYKKLLLTPFTSLAFRTLIPMLPKPIRKDRISPADTLDTSLIEETFSYVAIPINSIQQLFIAQNHVDITQVDVNNLSIFYGKYDLTVNTNELFRLMENAKIPFAKILCENSAHNLLEDYDREIVCESITKILLNIKSNDSLPTEVF